jgi:hypothetical protein
MTNNISGKVGTYSILDPKNNIATLSEQEFHNLRIKFKLKAEEMYGKGKKSRQAHTIFCSRVIYYS